MKRTPLEHVRRLIKKLPPEDRAKLVPYIEEFPDSGFHPHDLTEQLEVLKKHGTRIASPDDDPDQYIVHLVFLPNMVSAQIRDTSVLFAQFSPEGFIEAFPQVHAQVALVSEHFRETFTEEQRKAEREARRAQGIEETDEEYEADVKRRCDEAAKLWITEKGKRIAEQISLHLPGMVGDMMASAIKGQTFYDLYMETQELSPDKPLPSIKDFKKRVLDAAWAQIKPHLPRHTKTKPAWRGDDNLKQYAQRVNDRKALTTCIKDMYEYCDYEAGWIEDLKQDSTYQRLSMGVPDEMIEWAAKRIASDDMPPREREPLSVACEMARRELDLPEQNIETLRNYYLDGNRLLKKDRTDRKQ